MEKSISVKELSEEKKKELEKLTEKYSDALQMIHLFIEVNKLDSDEVWDEANQRYDSDVSYAPKDLD